MQVRYLCFWLNLLLVSCGGEQVQIEDNKKEAMKAVEVIPIQLIDYKEQIKAVGRFMDDRIYKLSFKTSGVIERIYTAQEGAIVREGQLMASLETEELNLKTFKSEMEAEYAEVALKGLGEGLKVARENYKEAADLYKVKLISKEEYEKVHLEKVKLETEFELSRLKLLATEKEKETHTLLAAHYVLRAPFDGIVTKLLFKEGEIIKAGMPAILFRPHDKTELKVFKTQLIEKDILQIREEASATIQFSAIPERTYQGKVQQISSVADPSTGTYTVDIAFNADRTLPLGLIGKATIDVSQTKRMAKLPLTAIRFENNREAIFFSVEGNRLVKQQIPSYHLDHDSLLVDSVDIESGRLLVKHIGFLSEEERVEAVRVVQK